MFVPVFSAMVFSGLKPALIQIVTVSAFYPILLTVSRKFSIPFHPRLNPLGVGHSWWDYIFSPTMRYGVEQPFAIYSLTSGLAYFQTKPPQVFLFPLQTALILLF